jgi:hypothetical protein
MSACSAIDDGVSPGLTVYRFEDVDDGFFASLDFEDLAGVVAAGWAPPESTGVSSSPPPPMTMKSATKVATRAAGARKRAGERPLTSAECSRGSGGALVVAGLKNALRAPVRLVPICRSRRKFPWGQLSSTSI